MICFVVNVSGFSTWSQELQLGDRQLLDLPLPASKILTEIAKGAWSSTKWWGFVASNAICRLTERPRVAWGGPPWHHRDISLRWGCFMVFDTVEREPAVTLGSWEHATVPIEILCNPQGMLSYLVTRKASSITKYPGIAQLESSW